MTARSKGPTRYGQKDDYSPGLSHSHHLAIHILKECEGLRKWHVLDIISSFEVEKDLHYFLYFLGLHSVHGR